MHWARFGKSYDGALCYHLKWHGPHASVLPASFHYRVVMKDAIASRLEAITNRLEAIALGAIASRLEATIALRLEAIAIIASRLEAIAS